MQPFLIRYPKEATVASLSCSISSGTIRVSLSYEAEMKQIELRPLSPLYNLTNASCGHACQIPLGRQQSPEVAAVTFFNDSATPANAMVELGINVLPKVNQDQLAVPINVTIQPGQSQMVHIVLQRIN